MCEQAQEHISIAGTMYREMDMPFWLDKAEGEMRQQAIVSYRQGK
jgi:hypothetical protein